MEELSDGAIYALLSNKDHERRVKAEERASIIASLREPPKEMLDFMYENIDPGSMRSTFTAIADYLERK